MGRRHEADRIRRDQERKRKALEAKVGALRAEFDAESKELDFLKEEEKARQEVVAQEKLKMKSLRKVKQAADREKAPKGKKNGKRKGA
jgi:circadian clock protein KaiC